MSKEGLTDLLKAIFCSPTTEKREEPRNCPWCGTKPKLYQTKHGMWWLECENYACPVQPMSQVFSRKDKLVRKWNERWKDGQGDRN